MSLQLGFESKNLNCPHCTKLISTRVEPKTRSLFCCCINLLCCWASIIACCCLICSEDNPKIEADDCCCEHDCQSVEHYCPNCNQLLGEYP